MSWWLTMLIIGLLAFSCYTICFFISFGCERSAMCWFGFSFFYLIGLAVVVLTLYSKEFSYPEIWWYFYYGMFALVVGVIDQSFSNELYKALIGKQSGDLVILRNQICGSIVSFCVLIVMINSFPLHDGFENSSNGKGNVFKGIAIVFSFFLYMICFTSNAYIGKKNQNQKKMSENKKK